MNKTFTWRLLTPGELTDVYLQEMRREAASKIVTPDSPGFGVPPTAGGKIQMP